VLIAPDKTGAPLHVQLYRQLRAHILSGALAPGALIPSSRTMAADIGVSRNTVEAAIGQLWAEGFVARRVGVGTIVTLGADTVPFASSVIRTTQPPGSSRTLSRVVGGSVAPSTVSPPRLSARGRAIAAGGRAELEADARSGPCAVDVYNFPHRIWQRLIARAARQHGADLLLPGAPQGSLALRTAISDHARLTRGLQCSAEQVLVLHSAQQALDLTSRLLLGAGDVALMEEPGYPSATAVFVGAGVTVRSIAVDDEGACTEQLRDHPSARLAYLTPSHQFPLGVTLSLSRRLTAINWARQTGAWILEDDYDSEFRYDDRPVAALQGLDGRDHVLYLGTFNKVLFPGIRLAYLVLPPSLVDAFTSALRMTDGPPAPLLQAALAMFIAEGHFAAHLRRSRRIYGARRDLLVEQLKAVAGDRIVPGASSTGLHMVAHFPDDADDVSIAAGSTGHGMSVSPLSAYYAGESKARGLLLGFGAAGDDGIRRGAAAIASELNSRRSAS
jgi:GntR family transcriptional regulator / MocR family aminotransferase